MPESNQIPRKRMRFSSSSASEILTTSKLLNQRDRSGRIAPSASHTGNRFRVHYSPSLSGKIDSRIIRTLPRVSIKDLRLRRVFSPSSFSSDWEYNAKGENRTKEQDVEYPCDSGISNIAKQGTKIDAGGLGTCREDAEAEDSLQTTPPDPELLSRAPISAVNEAECIREEINRQAMKKISTNLCSKSVLHPCSRSKIFKNPGSFSYKRLLPYLMQAAEDGTSSGQSSKPEISFGLTQPSISLSCNKQTGETTDAGAEDPKEEVAELMTGKYQLPETKPVSQSLDRVLDKHSAGSTSPLKRVIASSPNKKSVCSRRKLFKTPGSVNYRRMLPYLRDIQQDNPCVPETGNHQNNTEESAVSSMTVSEKIATPESDTCSIENEEPLPCEVVSVSPEPEKEQETQVKHVIPDTEKHVIPDTEKKLGSPDEVLGSEVPLSSPHVDSRSSIEGTSTLNETIVDNVVGEENMHGAEETEVPLSCPHVDSRSSIEGTSALNKTIVENVVGEENMYGAEETEVPLSSPHVDSIEGTSALNKTIVENVVGEEETEGKNSREEVEGNIRAELVDVVLGTPPSISPSKGILKRSIRGCRGTCSCLNCSSFRLNAERAFEFSRNQLLDTQVMVLDLVGEISHLRDMLSKYESADPNDSYKNQAGEAAKRACEAAELAKSRLHQMNDDLQVHCRIPNEQRARVKFAHYVHEKTILKASEPEPDESP